MAFKKNYLDIGPMVHIVHHHWVHNHLLDSGKDHEFHIVDLNFKSLNKTYFMAMLNFFEVF